VLQRQNGAVDDALTGIGECAVQIKEYCFHMIPLFIGFCYYIEVFAVCKSKTNN
jgi:hypothetical protein